MSIYDTHKPAASGGGMYLKLADQETVKLRIASEPVIFETEGERDDPNNPGMKVTQISTRYAWVVWNYDANAAQIWAASATFFKDLAALAQDDEWGDPQDYDIKIKRDGMELSTKYNITPSNNREPLNSEAQEAVKAVDLVEKMKASQFNQRVMWLSDYDKMAAGQPSAHADDVATVKAAGEARKATPSKTVKKDDVVIEDIGDEPINLDDIPF